MDQNLFIPNGHGGQRPPHDSSGGGMRMRIAVLGAGSWGTTVASLLAGRHDCTIWARDPELAREIHERDANSRYLPGFTLPSALKATADLEKAVHDVDLLVVGVPTHGFRAILVEIGR